MKTLRNWKSESRLDNIMSVMLIALALGTLAAEALDFDAAAAYAKTQAEHRV